MTSRNEKPAKPAWFEESAKKVILKKKDIFVKGIPDKVVWLRETKMYVPVQTSSVISRSAKAVTCGVFAECKAFAKTLRKGNTANGVLVVLLVVELPY